MKIYNLNKINDLNEDIIRILGYSIYKATKEKVINIINQYKENEQLEMYIYKDSYDLGVIAIKLEELDIEICHIAVDENARNQKIASKLIDYVKEKYNFRKLYLETDDDAVNFYKKVGFDVKNLGEKHKGYPRYLCSIRGKNEIISCQRRGKHKRI